MSEFEAWNVMTNRGLYSKVYDIVDASHPRKGSLGPYGVETIRNPAFLRSVRERIPAPARILDASCGRGHLVRQLSSLGYDVEGTEIVYPRELHDLKVHDLSYQELFQLPAKSYDAVISSDVLEHLHPEDIVVALSNLCRLTRSWIFISVGTRPARNYPQAAPFLGVHDLHRTIRKGGFWRSVIERFVDIDEEIVGRKNYYAFGRVRNWVVPS